MLGEAYEDKGKWYRNYYWICVCSECNRKVKVLENKVKSNDWIVGKGKYNDRGKVSW